MKKIFIFLMLGYVWFATPVFCQTPPGTTKIPLNALQKYIYVDKQDISNFSWLEYLNNLKNRFGEKSKQFQNALPDTAIWLANYPDQTLFPKTSKAIKDKPVMGLSYNQILDYCDWRTKRVNKKYHKDVRYQLMSQNVFLIAYKQRKLGFDRGDNLVVKVVGRGDEHPNTVKILSNWKVAFHLKKDDIPLNASFRCTAFYKKK